MDDAVKAEIEDLRDRLAEMTPEDRLEVFRLLSAGYCRSCGVNMLDVSWVCHCENDD